MARKEKGLTDKNVEKMEEVFNTVVENIRGASKTLRREIMRMKMDIRKTETDIRVYAQKNEVEPCKIMAKSLIRCRATLLRFLKQQASLDSLCTQIRNIKSQMKVTQAMGIASICMQNANELMNNTQLASTMQAFSQSMMKLGMKMEFQEQIVDNIFGEDDEEEEIEEEVKKVLAIAAVAEEERLTVANRKIGSLGCGDLTMLENRLDDISFQRKSEPIVAEIGSGTGYTKPTQPPPQPPSRPPQLPFQKPETDTFNNKGGNNKFDDFDLDDLLGPQKMTKDKQATQGVQPADVTEMHAELTKEQENLWIGFTQRDSKYDYVRKFYASQLTQAQLDLSKDILNALVAMQDNISYEEKNYTKQDFRKSLAFLRVELPHFFWICDYGSYTYLSDGTLSSSSIDYEKGLIAVKTYNDMFPSNELPVSKAGIKVIAGKMYDFVEKIIKNIMLPMKNSESELVKKVCSNFKNGTNSKIAQSKDCLMTLALNNFICNYADYCYTKGGNKAVTDQKYGMFGFFFKRSAVCQGYTHVMKYILNEAGIKSVFVHGKTIGTPTPENHCWLCVSVRDNSNTTATWGVIDSTWCDRGKSAEQSLDDASNISKGLSQNGTKALPQNGELSLKLSSMNDHGHTFFMIPDSFANRTRNPEEDEFKIPQCPDICLQYNPLFEIGLYYSHRESDSLEFTEKKLISLTNAVLKVLTPNIKSVSTGGSYVFDILVPDINTEDQAVKKELRDITRQAVTVVYNKIANAMKLALRTTMTSENGVSISYHVELNKKYSAGKLTEFAMLTEQETQSIMKKDANGNFNDNILKMLVERVIKEKKNKFIICPSFLAGIRSMDEFTNYIKKNSLSNTILPQNFPFSKGSITSGQDNNYISVEYLNN